MARLKEPWLIIHLSNLIIDLLNLYSLWKDIETFDAENAKTQAAISTSKPNPELLAQPGITPPAATAPPPAAAPVAGTAQKPVGSRPPVAAPAAPAKRSISSILGGK